MLLSSTCPPSNSHLSPIYLSFISVSLPYFTFAPFFSFLYHLSFLSYSIDENNHISTLKITDNEQSVSCDLGVNAGVTRLYFSGGRFDLPHDIFKQFPNIQKLSTRATSIFYYYVLCGVRKSRGGGGVEMC